MIMSIGFIGAGNIGLAFAKTLSRAGIALAWELQLLGQKAGAGA